MYPRLYKIWCKTTIADHPVGTIKIIFRCLFGRPQITCLWQFYIYIIFIFSIRIISCLLSSVSGIVTICNKHFRLSMPLWSGNEAHKKSRCQGNTIIADTLNSNVFFPHRTLSFIVHWCGPVTVMKYLRHMTTTITNNVIYFYNRKNTYIWWLTLTRATLPSKLSFKKPLTVLFLLVLFLNLIFSTNANDRKFYDANASHMN